MKRVPYLLFLTALLITACNPQGAIEVQEHPLYPVERITVMRGVVLHRAPFYVHDSQHPLLNYDADGEPDIQVYDANLFPTDVYIVLTAEMDAPQVFLARSPHGGCILRWEREEHQLIDPCFGSRFTLGGEYTFGPAQRHLDQLPSEVREGVVWVRNEIIYGEVHPGHSQ